MRSLLMGAVAALALAGLAAAQTPPGTPPRYAAVPTADQIAALYPPRARDQEVEGRAVVQCRVTSAGLLEACAVVSETPAGYGFGQATIEAAKLFRLNAIDPQGKPVTGTQIRLPVNWELQDDAAGPDLAAVDLATAARCFGTSFYAVEKGLGQDRVAGMMLTAWSIIHLLKHPESSDGKAADRSLRAAVAAARARYAATPGALGADLDACYARLDGLWDGPEMRFNPLPAPGSPRPTG